MSHAFHWIYKWRPSLCSFPAGSPCYSKRSKLHSYYLTLYVFSVYHSCIGCYLFILSFEVEDKLDSFYSGGDIAVSGHICKILYSTVINSNMLIMFIQLITISTMFLAFPWTWFQFTFSISFQKMVVISFVPVCRLLLWWMCSLEEQLQFLKR